MVWLLLCAFEQRVSTVMPSVDDEDGPSVARAENLGQRIAEQERRLAAIERLVADSGADRVANPLAAAGTSTHVDSPLVDKLRGLIVRKELGLNLHQCTAVIVLDAKAPTARKLLYLACSFGVVFVQCSILSAIMIAIQYPSCIDNVSYAGCSSTIPMNCG
jgi:hypothetical protein